MNDEGNLCDVGEEGEIVIKTSEAKPPGLFQGYYKEEKRTEKVWHDGYYHTGDTAWMDEDGYYWFVGRNDDMIKSSGYRIGPFEVESAVISHPSVLECAITGVPHSVRGQVVKATIVLTNNYKASDELAKKFRTMLNKLLRLISTLESLNLLKNCQKQSVVKFGGLKSEKKTKGNEKLICFDFFVFNIHCPFFIFWNNELEINIDFRY